MGIDADVLLRVRDRAALREAMDARADRERARWAEQGREAEYEELLAGGYDPVPLIRPLADGSVSIFTGIRFEDSDADFVIRCWLHEHFADGLAGIHDDPRGVFVSPDVCEPRATTYDGILEELGEAGRWIDPTPPSKEELAARERQFEEYMEGMEILRTAQEQGDEALAAALAGVAPHVRDAWQAQMEHQQRMARMANFKPIQLDVDAGEDGQPDMMAALQKLVGDKMTPEMMAQMEAMFADIAASAESASTDPRGTGRVSAAVPPAIWKVLEASSSGGFDVDDVTMLPDGSALVVTTRLGEDDEELMAQHLAHIVEGAGLDRASFGPLPFFRESLVGELRDAADLAGVVERLGNRGKLVPLRTFDETFRAERANVKAWLREEP